jgi:hypothetical protein
MFKEIKNIIIIIILLLLSFFGWKYYNDTSKLKDKYNLEVKLKEALNDSVRFYQTKEGEWVAEKRTLQGDMKDLLDDNIVLTDNQSKLLNDVKRLNKEYKGEKEIFAAARIQYETLIDSLNSMIASATNIDTVNNTVSFVETDTAAHFIYDLDVIGIRPYPEGIVPDIRFNKVDFPNTQTVTFQFDKNERKDYPVSFTVMNTNKYYKVYDMDSYVIPELQKDVINPSKFKKLFRWVKIGGKYILVGAAGYAIGAAVSK